MTMPRCAFELLLLGSGGPVVGRTTMDAEHMFRGSLQHSLHQEFTMLVIATPHPRPCRIKHDRELFETIASLHFILVANLCRRKTQPEI
jgi:hypothetical protein